jgi:hypothetical protein
MYRKKPVVVGADVYKKGMEDGWLVRIAGMDFPHEIEFEDITEAFIFFETGCTGTFNTKRSRQRPVPFIKTLEGPHEIKEGDYIITGVKGERYPCKTDIFEMTYEAVSE